ncbi:MAG TPA: hypothetical protein VK525_05855 [Candidatus Saccharimonadales bacterium]|nr:hypothetical protein [Candidatus Saccharimonadales bacterium]
MSAERVGRAPMMSLRELVNRYRALVAEYGDEVPLAGFALTHEEVERIFSGYDEDYHISRFFKFMDKDGAKFLIDGVAATHVVIDAEIESIL